MRTLLLSAAAQRGTLLLLLALTLGACSRASYPLLPGAPVAVQQVALVAPPASATSLALGAVAVLHVPTATPKVVASRHSRLRPAALMHTLRQATQMRPATAVARHQAASSDPGPPAPGRHKSRGVAFLLALPILGLGFFGLHLVYLGYHTRAAYYAIATFVGIVLLAIAIPGVAVVPGFLGAVTLGGVYLLALTDTIKILTGSLKPIDGEYSHSASLTRPDAAPPQP